MAKLVDDCIWLADGMRDSLNVSKPTSSFWLHLPMICNCVNNGATLRRLLHGGQQGWTDDIGEFRIKQRGPPV